MKATEKAKEFCAHNQVAMVINDIRKYFPGMSEDQILSEFTASKTYSEHFREENGLWTEVPDYIINMYLDEKGKKDGV